MTTKPRGSLHIVASLPAKRVRAANADTVAEAIQNAIIERALQPGTKLPEDSIGAGFGVSRTIVREALRKLAETGLVEVRRNKGARVARPSWDEARDVFDIRIALERIVVERLAGRLGRAQIAALEAHAAEEERAVGAGEPRSVRLATEFHILLARMTKSVTLARYVEEIAWRCGLTLTLYSRPHSSECGVNEHREIIGALVAGDAARAVAVMDHHLKGVVSRALIDPPAKASELTEILRR